MDKIKKFIHFLGFSTFLISGSIFADECEKVFKKHGKPLVKISGDTFEYQGLTKEGLKTLNTANSSLKERIRIFQNELRNMDTIHHAALVTRLFKGIMFLYGPPGGAKSAFVNFLMKGESEPSYKLQLHQMITEQAIYRRTKF